MASVERRRKKRIEAASGGAFISLGIVVMIWGPIDRPGEAMLFAMVMLLMGLLLGIQIGRKHLRFFPVAQPHRWISESLGGAERDIYETLDTLQGRVQLTEPAVDIVGLLALTKAPFIGPLIAEGLVLPEGRAIEWEGTWLLHTRDSAGRPVFLDEAGILAMLSYTDARADFGPLDRVLRSLEELYEPDATS